MVYPTSDIWKHCTEVPGTRKKKAACNVCAGKGIHISFRATSARRHLIKVHHLSIPQPVSEIGTLRTDAANLLKERDRLKREIDNLRACGHAVELPSRVDVEQRASKPLKSSKTTRKRNQTNRVVEEMTKRKLAQMIAQLRDEIEKLNAEKASLRAHTSANASFGRRCETAVTDHYRDDLVLAGLLGTNKINEVRAAGTWPDDRYAPQDLSMIAPSADDAFHNIPWSSFLKARDVVDLRGDEYLSYRVILAYLTYIAALAANHQPPKRVAVVSPQFTSIPSWEGQRAHLTTTGSRRNFEYALIPICVKEHWMLAIYDSAARIGGDAVVTFFDPRQNSMEEQCRKAIVAALQSVAENGPLIANIIEADAATFNRQPDGFNCGAHVCEIARVYLLNSGRTQIRDFNVNAARRKVLEVCIIIRGCFLLPRIPPEQLRQTASAQNDDVIVVRTRGVKADAIKLLAAAHKVRGTIMTGGPQRRLIEECLNNYCRGRRNDTNDSWVYRRKNYAMLRYADGNSAKDIKFVESLMTHLPLWQLAEYARGLPDLSPLYFTLLDMLGSLTTTFVMIYGGSNLKLIFHQSAVLPLNVHRTDPVYGQILKYSRQRMRETKRSFSPAYFFQPHIDCSKELVRDVLQSCFGAHISMSFYERAKNLFKGTTFETFLDDEGLDRLPREIVKICFVHKEECVLQRNWKLEGDPTGETYDANTLHGDFKKLSELGQYAIQELHVKFGLTVKEYGPLKWSDFTDQYLRKMMAVRAERVIFNNFSRKKSTYVEELKAAKRFALKLQYAHVLQFDFKDAGQLECLMNDPLKFPEDVENFVLSIRPSNSEPWIEGADLARILKKLVDAHHPCHRPGFYQFAVTLERVLQVELVLAALFEIFFWVSTEVSENGPKSICCILSNSYFDFNAVRQFLDPKSNFYIDDPANGGCAWRMVRADGWIWEVLCRYQQGVYHWLGFNYTPPQKTIAERRNEPLHELEARLEQARISLYGEQSKQQLLADIRNLRI